MERRNLSDWTKHDYKVALKKFYKWLKGDGERHPPEVKWIKTTRPRNNHLPQELLSEEEVERLIVGVPLILWPGDGEVELDFCFRCAGELGILDLLRRRARSG